MIFHYRKNLLTRKSTKRKNASYVTFVLIFDFDDSKLFCNFVYSAVSEKTMKPIR